MKPWHFGALQSLSPCLALLDAVIQLFFFLLNSFPNSFFVLNPPNTEFPGPTAGLGQVPAHGTTKDPSVPSNLPVQTFSKALKHITTCWWKNKPFYSSNNNAFCSSNNNKKGVREKLGVSDNPKPGFSLQGLQIPCSACWVPFFSQGIFSVFPFECESKIKQNLQGQRSFYRSKKPPNPKREI